jgi:20S proteasome subunit beta 7
MSNNIAAFSDMTVPPFWSGGPSPSGYYSFPSRSAPASSSVKPKTHSQYPITTGTSVFSIKYKDGVIIAADTMGSYGSLARFPDFKRVLVVNETTLVAFSGILTLLKLSLTLFNSTQPNLNLP